MEKEEGRDRGGMSQTPEDAEYERMRGEYLSLVASLEYQMTFLLSEYLAVGNHPGEFLDWFTHAPIPFWSKLNLFEVFIRDSSMLAQFGDVSADLRDSYEFRNTLAHSFRWFRGSMTARGKEIPDERVASEVLRQRLGRVRQLEQLVGAMLADHLQGPLPPISADDFADWPP